MPWNIRWKKVEWSAYDLVWDILPDAFQSGWEHEHLLRNVGSLPWPGLAWPNEYGLVCKVQWGDRVKRITGEEIVVSRLRLIKPGDTSRYEVTYRNPKTVVQEELMAKGVLNADGSLVETVARGKARGRRGRRKAV